MWPDIRFDPIKLFDLHISDLLFLDRYHVRMLVPGYVQLGDELFIGLLDAPDVLGYFCEVCPNHADWLRQGVQRVRGKSSERIGQAESRLLNASWPWNLAMAKSPEKWDALPWSSWDPRVIYDHIELKGKTVLDVGAGTGQVTIRCAPYASQVLALEPVGRLRRYIERKMGAAGFANVRTLDGILEAIPLEDAFVDAAILSNGSFGWDPLKELEELERVTKPGGAILMLGPCNPEAIGTISQIRDAGGYKPLDFELPCDGRKPAFIKRR
ncbi:MAG TPA: class I SAM-dependent methyltransferase [Armatimonadota bacterium]|nr:class I SAM-dependent methyltransferase [Armatimonadota bacterium]